IWMALTPPVSPPATWDGHKPVHRRVVMFSGIRWVHLSESWECRLRAALSPDGKLLAYPFEERRPVPKMKLAVISVDGEAPPKVLDAPGHVYGEVSLSWSGDGKALQYLLTQNGATNLWQQPIAGGKPKQLTRFTSGEIFRFNWSSDRKQLL